MQGATGLGRTAVLFLLAGCLHYTPKRIAMPPTEEAATCAADTLTDFEQCIIHQRGRGYCEQLRDTRLLGCPGAHEEGASPKTTDGSAPQLPGYRP